MWISGEAWILPVLGLFVLLVFGVATENEYAERRKLWFRRCAVWVLTIVLAGTFLVNVPMGLGGQLGKGNKVVRLGSVFAGFPARSFRMPTSWHYTGETKLSEQQRLRLDFTYSVTRGGKQPSVADAQQYFNTVTVPYGSAGSYFTTTLNRTGIDSLVRGYAQVRANGADSSVAVRPVVHALQTTASRAAMTVSKVSLMERRTS